MAKYNKTAMTVVAVVAIGAVIGVATPVVSDMLSGQPVQQAFGIRATDSALSYRRLPASYEIANGHIAIAPPRPDDGFKDYVIVADPATDKVCGVMAVTDQDSSADILHAKLTADHGAPTLLAGNTARWSTGTGYVVMQPAGDNIQAHWDFSGSCLNGTLAQSDPASKTYAQLQQ